MPPQFPLLDTKMCARTPAPVRAHGRTTVTETGWSCLFLWWPCNGGHLSRPKRCNSCTPKFIRAAHWLHFPGPRGGAQWRPLFSVSLDHTACSCTRSLHIWPGSSRALATPVRLPPLTSRSRAAQYLQRLWRPGQGAPCKAGQGRIGPDWAGLGRTGPDRARRDRTGSVGPE